VANFQGVCDGLRSTIRPALILVIGCSRLRSVHSNTLLVPCVSLLWDFSHTSCLSTLRLFLHLVSLYSDIFLTPRVSPLWDSSRTSCLLLLFPPRTLSHLVTILAFHVSFSVSHSYWKSLYFFCLSQLTLYDFSSFILYWSTFSWSCEDPTLFSSFTTPHPERGRHHRSVITLSLMLLNPNLYYSSNLPWYSPTSTFSSCSLFEPITILSFSIFYPSLNLFNFLNPTLWYQKILPLLSLSLFLCFYLLISNYSLDIPPTTIHTPSVFIKLTPQTFPLTQILCSPYLKPHSLRSSLLPFLLAPPASPLVVRQRLRSEYVPPFNLLNALTPSVKLEACMFSSKGG